MGTHDHDDVVRRLRALGREPLDPTLAEAHTSYLVSPPAARTRRRPMLAGALMAGAVLGGTGLAAALPGSLPQQAGSVARGALAAVKLVKDKPTAAEKAAAKASRPAKVKVGRFTEGCTTGTPPVPFTGNHGQYVKAHPDDPATPDVNERQVAAQSDCGKPLTSLRAGGSSTEADEPAKPAKVKAPKPKSRDDVDAGNPPGRPADAGHPPGRPADAGNPPASSGRVEDHPPVTAGKVKGAERPGHAGESTTTTTAG